MRAVPLGIHSPRAVSEALSAHGWDQGRAEAAAQGLRPFAVRLEGLDPERLEALVRYAGTRLGLDVLTGDGWAVLAGSRARLSAFARPWVGPPELAEVAEAVGHAVPAEIPLAWQTARGPLRLDRPILVGILNLTPDSFSESSRVSAAAQAADRAERMQAEGAAMVDLGGESTRPGATGVAEVEELRRVLPAVEAIVARCPDLLLSVDTVKSGVARAAIAAGAAVVNDVSSFRLDPRMAEVVASSGAGVVLMHSRGDVTTMASHDLAQYGGDAVGGVLEELGLADAGALSAGVPPDRIAVDPGLGFAKTETQSLLLLDQLAALTALGRPLMVGPSRKRFLGAATGRPVEDRDRATAAACALAWDRGARLFRVHAVGETRDALAVAHAVGGGAA